MKSMTGEDNNRGEGAAFLADLDETGWRTLLSYTDACPFQPGDVVVQMGDTDRALCIVIEGRLEVVVPAENEQGETSIAQIEAGSVFGEQSFLDGKPRSANIRGVTAGQMRVMSLRALDRLVEDEAQLATMLLLDLGRILSERLRRTTSLMNELYNLAKHH